MSMFTLHTVLRAFVLAALITFLMEIPCMAANDKINIRLIGGQAELGTIEIWGVGAGPFRRELWESSKLNFVPDIRSPLIAPRLRGLSRNIYAPSIVQMQDGWRVFYGAWDGTDTGNDRIYSLTTRDFVDFSDRQTVIEHGVFQHVCNVNAFKLPDGSYRLMCTAYPDKDGLNKPATFTSPDAVKWNGSQAPYAAQMSDIISMDGYDKYKTADINGMNVILYEDGVYRLYFNNFKDFGKVYRATSKDGKSFAFDGTSVDFWGCVNDVKKFSPDGKYTYLMGIHMNGDKLWYSLSQDGMKFAAPKELAKNLGDADRYIVAIGWVTKDNSVLGYLYGAGAVSDLNRNRIFGRWLQKKAVFVADDGTRYEPAGALGPDRQIIKVPSGKEIKGHFMICDEDGSTVLADNIGATIIPGAPYTLEIK